MSLWAAAQTNGIKSHTTIYYRIKGKTKTTRGRPILHLTHEAENAIMEKWTKRFVYRHKGISCRKGQILDASRFFGSNKSTVTQFYHNLSEVFAEYPSSAVWNCDETGVCAQGRRPPRVVCPKGMRANCVRSSDYENVSLLACISLIGEALPPMYIFASRKKAGWFEEGVPGMAVPTTDSSYIQGHIFYAWLKWFVHLVGSRGPQLIILKGHFSHLSSRLLHYAEVNYVNIFRLLAHTSSFLQPRDSQPFSFFKRFVEKEIHAFPIMNEGRLGHKLFKHVVESSQRW
ncbi:hypothetical protein THRCLA_22826 [Thraustotheca clavata]|uniref:DDE-1 domain-containing protein n=1 Tax=Thraustotheca clavata TaxID=74557 RepID=A0A1V9YSA4_9STRA|nr:hypothetical protein THRCLA_22826 [Thraustotheca clavata]